MEEVDIEGGAQYESPFKDLNPKSKVPVLIRYDGSVLTEYGTIAAWLASRYKAANLLPLHDLERQTRLYDAMDYLVSHIHGLAFPRIFFPERFAPDAKDDKAVAEQVKSQVRKMAEEGFRILGHGLGDQPYVVGDQFTIADTAFFFAEHWAAMTEVKLPANIQADLERMKVRPVVQKVMKAWGEA